MSLNALKSTGTKIAYRLHGTSDAFVQIAEVKDITGPGEKTTFLDGTSQDDTAEAVVPSGIDRFDELAFPINFIPSNATHDHITGMQYHRRNKTLLDVQMTYVDTSKVTFPAYVSTFKPKAPVDGIFEADISFKLTGAIVNS